MLKNTDIENNLTVINPEIPEIIDKISGAILPVKEVIGSDYEKVMKLRTEIRTLIARGVPRYICPWCHVPVNLARLEKFKRFFFKHTIEDGSCPAHTSGKLSEAEINARKYNGVKESEPHKEMKKIISESLQLDGKFKEVAVEQVLKGQEPGKWRKPDVSATFDNKVQIVFEIQLSTTFLRVIVERKEFYLKEDRLLCWIFKEIKEEYPRLMQDDIFYSNNHNLFLASEETLRVSRQQEKFFLKCCWVEPTIENQQIINTPWKEKIVPFDELTLDFKQQRIFFFDYEVERQKLVRKRFEDFWLSNNLMSYSHETSQKWQELGNLLAKCDVTFPTIDIAIQKDLGPLLNFLYSAKHGKPIGYKFKYLIEVAHLVENGFKRYLWIFGWALIKYGRDKQIKGEDSSGKWAKKVEKFKPLMQEKREEYQHDKAFDKLIALLIAFLFPELADKLNK